MHRVNLSYMYVGRIEVIELGPEASLEVIRLTVEGGREWEVRRETFGPLV